MKVYRQLSLRHELECENYDELQSRVDDAMRAINSRDLGYKCTNVDVCYAMNDVPRQKFDRIRADAEMIINEWKAAAT